MSEETPGLEAPEDHPGSPDRDGQGQGRRLPPPAFPPGSRRIPSRRRRRAAAATEEAEIEGSLPDDAFIDPDEPIVRPPSLSDDAFIDPDEPIVRSAPPTRPEDFEEVVKGGAGDVIDPDEVVVTGMGNDPHLEAFEGAAVYEDVHVADLVRMVGYLADQLRQKGEAGLKTEAGMSRFEASLRAYCTGYLNAQRGTEGNE
jgi:hypothetical protein